ncbi:FecR domain-containing protein [Pseudomonas syringae USA007]|uniref:FecR domain-containing protein n=1 Tax=Pseudomonas syringae USA007 TaxID=1357288 RepID=A0AAU8M5M3_PSESX|nr:MULTISPECIES: FecR domain-containing protein [Pseudomonas syringae group]MCR8719938.1 FecR domain-containing protein [Pseudomonas syringae]
MSAEPSPINPSDRRPDDVSHQASAWFALVHGGSPTEAEREALAKWLAADNSHTEAYAQLERLWTASALLLRPTTPATQPQLSRRRFVGLGIAASVVAVTAGGSTFWLKGMGSPFADIRTSVGERRTVNLPDGSSVDLAGNTALNLDFSAPRRSVELLQGEAFFNVVQSAGDEFNINTKAGRVATTGGEFCLSCDNASALLAVSRKTVRVVTANQQTDLGEGLSLRFGPHQTGAIQHAELDQILAWRSGRLVFFDKPLLTVIDELRRWREGKIFIMDKQLAARRVSLILNLDRPDQMVEAVTKALSVRVIRYTDLVTLIYPA